MIVHIKMYIDVQFAIVHDKLVTGQIYIALFSRQTQAYSYLLVKIFYV